MIILSFACSILTPKVLKALSVCITSSDISKLLISEIPIDIEGIIIDLWEIDLSDGMFIFPTIPSGNTNAACIMVGEKVSQIIKESIN